jgi:hypothetical protein
MVLKIERKVETIINGKLTQSISSKECWPFDLFFLMNETIDLIKIGNRIILV